MWATKPERNLPKQHATQAGVAAIEFALLVLVFLTFVFGIIELARLLFVYNTLQEVTRRAATAATSVYPTADAAIEKVKQDAIFRDSPGELVLAPPITDKYIRLAYLAFDLSPIPTASLPTDAASNRQVCAINPHAANCIRFVQAQVCAPEVTDTCQAVTSKMLFPLIDLRVPLHRATTITPVGSLGYMLGSAPPPPCSC